jgi:hypothetical protein
VLLQPVVAVLVIVPNHWIMISRLEKLRHLHALVVEGFGWVAPISALGLLLVVCLRRRTSSHAWSLFSVT